MKSIWKLRLGIVAALALVAGTVGFVGGGSAFAAAGDVSGNVFDDVDNNGTNDGEPGLAGVVVTAYDAAGSAAGSATTDSSGDYTISGLTDGVEYRIEFTSLPTDYVDGPSGTDSQSSVTFATPETGGVDYGAIVPEVCRQPPANALLNTYAAAVSCSAVVDPTYPKDAFGLLDIDSTVPATGRVDQSASTPMFHHPDWHIDQIGNVFGTAVDNTRGTMFAAASSNYSHAFYTNVTGTLTRPSIVQYGAIGGGANDLGAAGTLYQMDAVTGAPSVFVQLPQQSSTITHIDCEGNTTLDRTTGPGLGNVVYDETNDQLFVSNWEDGHIYRVSMGGTILDAYDPDQTDDGTAGMANGRVPFALETANDGSRLFFGTVLSREVWSIDLTAAGGFTGTSSVVGGTTVFANSSSEQLNQTISPQGGEPDPNWLNNNLMHFVSDLEILPGGQMLAGMRVGCSNNPHGAYNHQGQTHRLTANGAGLFNGDNGALNVSATGDAGLDDNYGGVDFYNNPTTGTTQFAVTSADILTEAGPHGLAVFADSSAGGGQKNPLGAIDYGTTNDPKGIAGDVSILNVSPCTPSPLEIGNRVWLDLDNNGVQDPGEAPLVDVTVTLFASDGVTVLDTTTTDANGEYTFGDASGVAPNTGYVLGFDVLTSTNALPAGFTLADLSATMLDVGAASNPDLTDSDLVGTTISVTTGGPGSNDHSFDAGFSLPYDLALTQTYTSDTFGNTSDGVIENGEDVTFTITVTNQGFMPSSGYQVTNYIPAGFSLNDAAWTDNGDGTATFSAGALSSGVAVDIPITLTANSSTAGDLVNWAEISVDDGDDVDSTPDTDQGNDAQPAAVGDPTDDVNDNSGGDEDDHDPAGVTVIAYDLALTKSYTSDTFGNTTDGVIENGEDAVFTITVTNQGTVAANSFDVTDYLPAGFVLNDAAWTDNGDGTATFSAGPLAAGASEDLTITVTSQSSGAGPVVNWAEISSDDGNDPDSVPDTDQGNDNQPAAVGDPTDGVIDNSVDGAGDPDEDDHDPAGIIVDAYDLALTQVYTSDTFDNTTDGVIEEGSDVTFTITVTNQGTVAANSYQVTDYLPAGFDLNDAAWTDNGDGTATFSAGPLAASGSVDLTITMTATSTSDGNYVNWAEISVDDGNDADSVPDTDQGNDNQPAAVGDPTDGVIDNSLDGAGDPDEDDHDPAGVTVGSFDLALTKTYTSDTFGNTTDGIMETGDDVTFTITVTNQGTLDAATYTVTDHLPAGYVLNDAAWTDGGATATFTGGPLVAGASEDITITLTASTAGDGDHVNWAEISSDDGNDVDSVPDTDQGNDNQPAAVGDPTDDVIDNTGGDEDDHDPAGVTISSYDLALTQTYTSDTFGNTSDGVIENGENVTFTITVTNQGSAAATSYELVDYLPAGFSLNDAAWTDNGDGTATFNAGPLAAGASQDITITLTADSSSAGDLVNWVEISGDDGNDSDSTPDTDQGNDAQPAAVGDPTDDVNDNSGGDEDDHDPAGVTVIAYDLALTKSYTSDTFGAPNDGVIENGSDAAFTITVTNQGTVAANSFEVTDYLPAGFDLNDASWSDNGDGTATISAGPLAAGASVDLTITMTATTATVGEKQNWAEISSDDGNDPDSTPDTNQGNDNQPGAPGDPTDDVIDNRVDGAGDPDEDDHDVAGIAVASYDLALTQVYTSDTFGNTSDGVVEFSSDVTFTITVTNQGTVDANSFSVTDYIPTGLTLNDAAWTDNGDGTATINGGPLLSGASVDIPITFTVDAQTAGDIVNWAEISADDGNDADSVPDTDQANDNQPAAVGDPTDDVTDNSVDGAGDPDEDDHDPAGVSVEVFDLALTKEYTSDTFANSTDGVIESGADVTYTIEVFNQGTINATTFDVTDHIPTGFTLNDAAWTDNGDGTATFTGGPLVAGRSELITITLSAGAVVPGTYVNWAEISSDDGTDVDSVPDTDPGNDNQPSSPGDPTDGVIDNSLDGAGDPDEDDHDPAGVGVANYDLALIKTYTSDTFGNTTDGLAEDGADVTFTITVLNQGTIDANSFDVVDYLPAGFDLNDAAWTDNSDGTATFNAGPLAAGSSVDIPVTLTVAGAGDGQQVNWAEISSDDGNDIDSVPDTDQTNDNQPSNPGDPTDDATDNSVDGAGDPDSDDHDLASVDIASYDLSLTQVYTSDTFGNTSDGVVENGSDVTFTITVTNQGGLDATNYEITNYWPSGFDLNDAAWTDNGDGTATFSAGPLLSGATVDIPITLTAVSVRAGDAMNWAEISADDANDVDSVPDTDPGNDNQPAAVGDPTDNVIDNSVDGAGDADEDDHDPAGVTLVEYDLALTKIYTSDTLGNTTDGLLEDGADVTFTITVINQGTIDAASFEVTDHIPAGFDLNDAAWTDNGDGTATFIAGALLSGASVDIPITLTANGAADGDYVNWAEISADDGDDIDSVPDTDQRNDSQPAAVGDPTDDVVDNAGGDEDDHDPAGMTVGSYDLALSQMYTSDTFGNSTDGVIENGADVTFTITVTNQGTIDAANYAITNYIPTGFSLNDPAWTDAGSTATFSAGALLSGASVDIPITLTADTAVPGSLVNWAEISTDDGNDVDSVPDTDPGNDNQPAAVGDPTDDVVDNSGGDEDDHDPAGVDVAFFDLALTKVYTSDTFGLSTDGVVQVGADITFTIEVFNQGTIDAASFEVTDYIPTGFTLNDAAWTDNGDGTATFGGRALASGRSVQIPITLTAATASVGDGVNLAEISSDDGTDVDSVPDTDPGNDNQPVNPGDPTDDITDNTDSDEDDHDIAGFSVVEYDLALSQVYTSDTFGNTTDGVIENGADATFTITVFNQGTIDATNYSITNTIPAGFSLNDAAWTDNGDGTATISSGPLVAGASEDLTITLTADTARAGDAVNWAEISADDGNDVDSVPDTDQANDNQPRNPGDPTDNVIDNSGGDEDDHDPAGVTVAEYDLALTKVYTADTFGDPTDGSIENGTDVTFTITVFNQGDIDATAITLTDFLPSGFTLNDAAWTDNGNGTANRAGFGPIPASGSLATTITMTATSATFGESVNIAEISRDDGNDIDSNADGGPNNDNQPANPGDPTDDVVDNSGGDEDDHDIAGVSVERYDLALITTFESDTFDDPIDGVIEPNADVTFEIEVTNQGTIDATSFEVTAYLPVGFVLNDVAWTDNGDGTATIAGGPLAASASDTISLTATGVGVTTGTYVLWAEISADDGNDVDSVPDTDQGNDNQPSSPGDPTDDVIDNSLDGAGNPDEDDHDPAAVGVENYDLALIKSLTDDGFGDPIDGLTQAGEDATFTITVINQGTLDAASFEVTDYLPAGFVLNDAAWTDNGDGTASFIGRALSSGTSVDIPITLSSTGVADGVHVNVAEISSDDGNDVDSTTDSNDSNDNQPVNPGDPTDGVTNNALDGTGDPDEDDHDIAGLTVGSFDLALIKVYTSDTSADGNSTDGRVQPGDDVTFTITVSNQGDLEASTVEVTDTLPSGFVLNDAAWTDGGADATITVGPLAPGASTDVTITMTATGRIPGDVINVAEISSDTGNDVDSVPDTDQANDNQPRNPGDPTDDVVDNSGGDEDDHDIAGLTLDVYDLELEKDFVSDTSVDGNSTDGLIQIGDDATFDVQISNTGTVDATTFEVTDYMPAGFVLNDPAWTDNGDGTASINAGPLAAGSSVTIPITITSVNNGAGDLVNWAEISADDGDDIDSMPNDDPDDDGDPPTEDDIDDAPLTVDAYDLALRKVLDSNPVIQLGDDVTFTITVFNQGTADASSIDVTDYLPNGFTLNDGAWTDNGDGTASRSVGALAAGASADLAITMTATSASHGDHVNGAEISSDDGSDVDSTPNADPSDDGTITDDEIDNANGDEDDHDTAPVRLVARFDLALVKTLDASTSLPVVPQQDVMFSLRITNEGSTDASDIELTDYVDLSMWDAFDAADNPDGTTTGDQTFTYSWSAAGTDGLATIAGTLGAGESINLPVTLTIAAGAPLDTMRNVAEISSATPRNPDGSVPPVTDEDSTPDSTNDDPPEEDDHDDALVEPPTLSLGNVVWFDDNFDGVFDADEDPVGGVTLVLLDGDGDPIIGDDGQPRSVVTAPDGTYLFDGLDEGTYIVEVLQSNFAEGGPLEDVVTTVGNDVAAGLAPDPDDDVDADDNGSFVLGGGAVSQPIVLNFGLEPDGNVNLTVDFGFIPAAGLGSIVWFDNDRDGVQDASETGVPDVDVIVTHIASGQVFGTDTTDATGNWSVTGLPPGDYTVTFDDPENRVFTSTDRGDDALDSDARPDGTTGTVVLSAGEYDPTIDAGIFPPQPLVPTIAFTGSSWAMAFLAWAIGFAFLGWAFILMSRDPEENPYIT